MFYDFSKKSNRNKYFRFDQMRRFDNASKFIDQLDPEIFEGDQAKLNEYKEKYGSDFFINKDTNSVYNKKKYVKNKQSYGKYLFEDINIKLM